jgi:hypothetical protein
MLGLSLIHSSTGNKKEFKNSLGLHSETLFKNKQTKKIKNKKGRKRLRERKRGKEGRRKRQREGGGKEVGRQGERKEGGK